MSGENCKSDGGLECESCNSGFKLRQDKTACDGRLLVRGVIVTRMLDACSCFAPGMDVRRFGTFMPCYATHVFVRMHFGALEGVKIYKTHAFAFW